MSTRISSFLIAIAAIFAVWSLGVTPAAGQPLPTPPEAHTWDPPRTPDGQPDIQGIWSQQNRITTYSIQEGAVDRETHIGITGQEEATGRPIIDPPDGRIPYQPWAAALQQELEAVYENPTRPEHIDTQTRCLGPGVPRLYYFPRFRILQPAGSVVFVWDQYHSYRVIPLDGRPHVSPRIKLWSGDGRGRFV